MTARKIVAKHGELKPHEKIARYFEACWKAGGFNLMGLPLLPRGLFPALPHNRTCYNDFLIWISLLGLRNVSVVVDVGANHGDFSEAASSAFPAARVLLFEPLPKLHPILERRCQRHAPLWKLETCALSDTEGTLDLHIAPERDEIGSLKGFSRSYLESTADTGEVRKIPCRVRRLDDVAREHGFDHVDLLKIDVEGAEFEVLAGAKTLLAATESLVVEVSTIREDNAPENALLRLLRLLDGHGFQPVAILPSLHSPRHEWMPVEFNVLARRAPR